MKLTARSRNNLPDSDFALPGRRYPIEDKNHVIAAKSMVAQHGTPAEQHRVLAAIKQKFGDAKKKTSMGKWGK